jgi:hypothetical protein
MAMRHILGRELLARLYIVVAVLVASLCAPRIAVASDQGAPAWRGTAGSTFQEWSFSTNARPATPESYINSFGVPSASIDNVSYVRWYNALPAVYGSAQGWWDIAASSVVLSVTNHPNIGVNVSKEIQVRVTYWVALNLAPTVVVTPSASLVSKTTTLVEHVPDMGAWYEDVWTFRVDPNQNSENITVNGHPTGGSQIDEIVVDTRYVAAIDSAGQVRTLPEDTVVELTGPVVTRSFSTFFYMENRKRIAGIRVNCAAGQTPAAEGTAPTVTGVVRVVDGERAIDEATVVPGGSGSVLPLGMNGMAGRTGVSAQGLFVKLWGRAHVESPSATSFTLDDGSVPAVRVQLSGVDAPEDGKFVAVSGVLGADNAGPILRVNTSDTLNTIE